jgi:release factor glutamine methyltransferase
MKSVLETINGGASYLEKRGIEDARRNMEHLLAKVLQCSRMQLYTQFDRPLEEVVLAPLRELLKKRGEGIPLQHILGEVAFHGRDFICDGRGLIPRPETEELVEMILKQLPDENLQILDVGCGSGVIGLSLAAEKPASHGLSNVEISRSDLFDQVRGSFDLIVANLPYVPESEARTMTRELSHDPTLALFSGADGMDLLRRFIPAAYGFLKPGGWLALEIGYDQASQVRLCLEESGFAEIEIKKDLSGIARFPFAKHH